MNFEFATATQIIFGAGRLREIGPLAKAFGYRALVVTGSDAGRAKPLQSLLDSSGVSSSTFSVAGEPTVRLLLRGVQSAKADPPDLVISFGGGSAIDAGKAIAALMTNDGDLFDYLEVIGRGKPLTKPPLPFIAIPTTAGAGAEVTRNAVLSSPEHRVKVSLRSPLMLPRIALVDPELTYDLPAVITASTGLDALTQLIEPFVSSKANPLTDSLCVEGMRRVARSLKPAFDHSLQAADGNTSVSERFKAAREDMALAASFGGLALSNAGLGAVHGFAAPIGGMFPAPHGAVCAALLPHVMEANLRALRERASTSESLRRYDEAARLLTSNANATADDGVAWARALRDELGIRPLGDYGVTDSDLPALVENAAKASSMKANPIALTTEEMRSILARALRH